MARWEYDRRTGRFGPSLEQKERMHLLTPFERLELQRRRDVDSRSMWDNRRCGHADR